jgi:fatty acid desaturase
MTRADSNAPPARSGWHILANPQDLHCVVFHITCLVAYSCAFWLYQHPKMAGITGPWSRVAFVLASALMLGWISGIDVGVNFHNHSHRPIFTSQFVNRWFGRLWTFSGGWPSFFWEYCHVTIHHAKLLSADDWTLPKQKADGTFEDLRRYVFMHWPWRLMTHLWRDLIARRSLRRKSVRELAIFLALWSIPFWIDPVMAIWLWLLPHWIANAWVMGSGMYVQHAGCVPKSLAKPFSHSTVFVSKFFNLTMFNIGFHLEHHDYPRVHWSELPALHQRLKQDMIEGGAHVVSYGLHHASLLLVRNDASKKRFTEQAAGYERSR